MIRIREVTLKIQDHFVLDQVSFDLPLNTLTYLVGCNGSGKSSLLKAIAGNCAVEGFISFDENSLATNFIPTHQITWVPQLNTQPFPYTVHEFVLLGRFDKTSFWGDYSIEDIQIVESVLHKWNLDAFRSRQLSQLSGGELQKVVLAQAYVRNTPIWLLDEPARFLDPYQRILLYQLLQEIRQENKTLICITHDEEAFLNQPQVNVLGLKEGKICWQGTVNSNNLYQFRETVYGISPN